MVNLFYDLLEVNDSFMDVPNGILMFSSSTDLHFSYWLLLKFGVILVFIIALGIEADTPHSDLSEEEYERIARPKG